MERWIALSSLIVAALVISGCQTRPMGGLEGRTLDTPEQAFSYFRDAVELERYDLEYGVFSQEFIDDNGGFSLQDYVRGRPWATGEQAELLDDLPKAEVAPPEYSDDGRVARLVLSTGRFRGEVFLVRKTFWRIGIDGFPAPIKGTMNELASLITVGDGSIGLTLPLTPGTLVMLGGEAPQAGMVTRVEAAHRWYLRSIGAVERK